MSPNSYFNVIFNNIVGLGINKKLGINIKTVDINIRN